jgi:hypothetical protein
LLTLALKDIPLDSTVDLNKVSKLLNLPFATDVFGQGILKREVSLYH